MTDHTTHPVHISVILDRSGSMSAIADDVVGGFNEFLDRQRARDGAARVTLAQFDSEDPFEVLLNGVDLASVRHLRRSEYIPRSSTPLFDAVGRMIGRADSVIAERSAAAEPEEDQIVVVVTDGLENASVEHDRASIFAMVEDRRAAGWVFVFLGANQDAYAEGGKIGVAPGNAAAWAASPAGVKKMWKDLEHSTALHRAKSRAARMAAADTFYAEADED